MPTSQIHSGLYCLNGAFLENVEVLNLPPTYSILS